MEFLALLIVVYLLFRVFGITESDKTIGYRIPPDIEKTLSRKQIRRYYRRLNK